MGRLKGIPFLRLDFYRMLFRMRTLLSTWQVGDGREEQVAKHVEANARKGDTEDCIRVIDEFAWNHKFLINVGDEKGKILDDAIRKKNPRRILELGTYCGYSALRMAAVAPEAEIVSIEFNADNADIANRILAHGGVEDRVHVVVGTIGDGGKTVERLKVDFRGDEESFDFVFVDHDKSCYLPDLKTLLETGLLSKGAVVVADNIKFPGAPDYLEYMQENEGVVWKTEHHETVVEYQSVIKDLVLVSELLMDGSPQETD